MGVVFDVVSPGWTESVAGFAPIYDRNLDKGFVNGIISGISVTGIIGNLTPGKSVPQPPRTW